MESQLVIPTAIAVVLAFPMTAATPAWLQFADTVSDAQGNTYAVGFVTTDIVPVTPGAFQTTFNGGTCGTTIFTTNGFQTGSEPIPCQHGFAAKISADGSTVLYATYLEGARTTRCRSEQSTLPGTSTSSEAQLPRIFPSPALSPDG